MDSDDMMENIQLLKNLNLKGKIPSFITLASALHKNFKNNLKKTRAINALLDER